MIYQTVGVYKIIEKIGEGGMGSVYRAIDTMLDREVAIKALKPELARQPEIVERFRKEAVTLAKLNHPNIATIYGFLRSGEDYFMIMEFVRGKTLEQIIRDSGAMPCEQAIGLFCQALDGIEHAHRLGIIHRDIKPANLMITEAGSIKVMDFGIARALGSARTTRTGMLVGTLEYMSPEQIKGLEVDARSDIYSLGILLYEMLVGRVPFESDSDYELMRAHVEELPRPPRELAPHIPLQIEQSIMRALAKKPGARFQSAAEFRDALLGTHSIEGHRDQLSRPKPAGASLLNKLGWKHMIAAALLTFVSALSILIIIGGRKEAVRLPAAGPPASAPPRLEPSPPQPMGVETPSPPTYLPAQGSARPTAPKPTAPGDPSQQEAKPSKRAAKDRAAASEPKGGDEPSEKKDNVAKGVIKKPVEGIKKVGGWLGFGKKKKDQQP